MRHLIAALFLIIVSGSSVFGKVVVFWQEGFPTVASQPVSREALAKALEGADAIFAGIDGLQDSAALTGVDLLILPDGSAVPTDGWRSIQGYLRAGGNLLVLGGQPLRVPVTGVNGKYIEARPQDTYSHELDIRHTYEVPRPAGAKFSWRTGYSFPRAPEVRARRFFTQNDVSQSGGFARRQRLG